MKELFNNLKIYLKNKKITYTIRLLILKQIINRKFYENYYIKNALEKTDVYLFQLASNKKKFDPIMKIIFPFYLVGLGIKLTLKYSHQFYHFWLFYCSNEIWDIILDLFYIVKSIVLFPFNLFKAIKKFLNKPRDTAKIIPTLTFPISIRLYRLIKKYIWMPLWIRFRLESSLSMFLLWFVNYNYSIPDRNARWFSYKHQPADGDWSWELSDIWSWLF